MKTSGESIAGWLHGTEPRLTPERRGADLLLVGVTATALLFLFLLTPNLGIVAWLYVLQHSIVLVLALTRSAPRATDCSFSSSVAVAVAYLYGYAQVICLYWWPSKTTWGEGGLALVTVAAIFSVICLLTIGKNFGVRPTLRGLATSGPYALVRHPLYLSYVIADVGFNLQASNLATILLVVLGLTAMLCRIRAEERVLSRDRDWPLYVASVPYRLILGVW